jgi:hypothetical protein
MAANGLQDDLQSAYRSHASTETALIKVNNDILQTLDKGQYAALILLDLSAAFDTLDHDVFLKRARNTLGITGQALEWLRSYFQHRTQAVTVGDATSRDAELKYGVPQGSVLGPKGYCMYTLPLGGILRRHNMKYMIYADDTQAYLSISNASQWTESANAIAACFKEIRSWMNSNFLKLNDTKTEFIIFSPNNHQAPRDLCLKLGDNTVSPSERVRNLGVILDSHLSMEQQINATTKTCYFHLRAISKIRKCLPEATCKTLVQALVISRLDYGNALYNGLPQALLSRLQRTQNAAARVITGAKRHDHITPHLQSLHWLPVQSRVQYKLLLHTFKAINHLSPGYMTELVPLRQNQRSLRSSSKPLIQVPRTRTARYGDRTFSASAARLWNSLPGELHECLTVFSFKKLLKTALFKSAFNL